MADGTVGEGAVTVHTGAAVVTGTGGEVPVRHAERGRDPAKDTRCKRRLQAHGFSRGGEQSVWVEERKGSKGISGCSNVPWFAAVQALIGEHVHK